MDGMRPLLLSVQYIVKPRIKKSKRPIFFINFGFVGEIENARPYIYLLFIYYYVYYIYIICCCTCTERVCVYYRERKKFSHILLYVPPRTYYTNTHIKLVHSTLILSDLWQPANDQLLRLLPAITTTKQPSLRANVNIILIIHNNIMICKCYRYLLLYLSTLWDRSLALQHNM